jgi:hypothetical protein
VKPDVRLVDDMMRAAIPRVAPAAQLAIRWHGELVLMRSCGWLDPGVAQCGATCGSSRPSSCAITVRCNPSKRRWDGPLCWIDATTLAVWGEGRDDEQMLPAVRLFDVATGNSLDWFPEPDVAPHRVWPPRSGQPGWIVYHRYLFAISPQHGTGVWDSVSGERLLHNAAFVPLRYHRGAAQFLTLQHDGSISITHLVDGTEMAAPQE